MRLARRTLLLAATALIALPVQFPALAEDPAAAAAASPSAAPSPASIQTGDASKDYTIIKFRNEEIKNSEVLDIWNSLFPGGAAPDFNKFDENIRQNVLRGLISERLIYQEAKKAGFDTNEEVQKRLATLQRQVIMQAFMDDKARHLATDSQLKAAYDEKVKAAQGQDEVKARHILVDSEEEAQKLADQIKKTAASKQVETFEKLAKTKSADKGSGANGGELGWFTKDKMVPEFADAAYALKKGEISDPIRSPFGYHIIMVEDRRPVQMPSFEEMKEGLRGEVANRMIQSYLEDMLKSANIKYYGADGKQRPFSTSLTPPLASAGDVDGGLAN